MYREVNHTLVSKVPPKDADPLPPPSVEQVVYWIARTTVALAGLGALALPVMAAKEHPRSWVPLTFSLIFGLLVGAMMLCPNRLTVAGWPFVCRLVASILVGVLVIVGGLDGGQGLLPTLICGLGLPGCLWWRSFKTARKSGQGLQELS
jgi:hypothetical protein